MSIFLRSSKNSGCKAVLGPTNTGKTYYAIERMLSYQTGIIGVPLRLLAREIYDKIVDIKGKDLVALNTGEEKIIGDRAKYWVCTTEAMPQDKSFEFLAVDEIQLCADEERGHVFTDRLINSRGTLESLFLGSKVMQKTIKAVIPDVEILSRERLSKLSYCGRKRLSKLGPRSAIVDFSVDRVYELAEQLRSTKGGAAVVLGALSPRTRNAQVELYQNGDVDYLVATDAIGLGLNLNIKNIFFASTRKFDGQKIRSLSLLELAQIAGRAGRHQQDGFFGETGLLNEIDEKVVYAIENNLFPMHKKIKWRNSNLDFKSVQSLINSLDKSINSECFEKVKDVTDVITLKFLLKNDISGLKDVANEDVELLWKVCQIPDFRKISNQDHSDIIIKLFNFVKESGGIPESWFEKEISRLDNTLGDIDALSKRLSFVRTWCFVANKESWLENSSTWEIRAREIEDKLSEALHVKLTQRFVDLRRSVLVKRSMTDKEDNQSFVINTDGLVYFHDQLFGSIEGFNFYLAGNDPYEEKKKLTQIIRPLLQQYLGNLVDKLYLATGKEIEVSCEGDFYWNSKKIATLEKGKDIFSPKIRINKFDELTIEQVKKIEKKLSIFLEQKMGSLLENLIKLKNTDEFKGVVRGLIHRYLENLGIIPKSLVIEEFRGLDVNTKQKLKNFGMRFGYKIIYEPLLLKPEVNKLRLALFSVFSEGKGNKFNPSPGLITMPHDKDISRAKYLIGGFFVVGNKIIRIDMLERLFFMLRNLDQQKWFEPSVEMLSITGLGLKDFAEMMKSLGFSSKTEKYLTDNELLHVEESEAGFKKEMLLTYATDGEDWRVFLRKTVRQFNEVNEKQKNKKVFLANKKVKNKYSKKKKEVEKTKDVDLNSPFASLKQLLKN